MAGAADKYERRLAREGLGALDYPDGAGGIMVSNRGSGKVDGRPERAVARESGEAEMRRRSKLLSEHRMRRVDRRVYALFAAGESYVQIGRRTRRHFTTIKARIERIEREYAEAPGPTLLELLGECEPTTIALMFALIERALEAPGEMRELVGQARSVPELRALIQPDEVDDG